MFAFLYCCLGLLVTGDFCCGLDALFAWFCLFVLVLVLLFSSVFKSGCFLLMMLC